MRVRVGGSYLFNTVPVGLGQVEAAGGCSGLVAHHAEFSHGGEALSSSRHTILPWVEQPPVVPCWCYNSKEWRQSVLF